MTESNRGMHPSALDKPAGGLAQKQWRRPVLQRLPIDATAGATAKASGAQNDGSGSKSGDVSNFS